MMVKGATPLARGGNLHAKAIKRDMCARDLYEDSDAGRAIKARDCANSPTFDGLHGVRPKPDESTAK